MYYNNTEVEMNKKFLITGLLLMFAIPSFAEVTVEDTHNPDFLRNSGYSDPMIKATQKQVAIDNAEGYELEPVEYKKNSCAFVKGLKRFFIYIDPALDDNTFMNRNITTTPDYHDM